MVSSNPYSSQLMICMGILVLTIWSWRGGWKWKSLIPVFVGIIILLGMVCLIYSYEFTKLMPRGLWAVETLVFIALGWMIMKK